MSIAIVTGASSGIGAEFCRRLDEKGLDCIWMIARRTELLQNISSTLDTPTRIFSVDLSDRESLSSFNSLIEKEGPSISYLVNCAGLGKFGKTWEISDESTLSMIDLNITALVEITRTCIPFMKKGGHIIEFCSESAYIPLYELNVYASTKAFVRHFCGGLRHELKDREVSVTEVSPGWVQTDFIEKSMSENNAPKKIGRASCRERV